MKIEYLSLSGQASFRDAMFFEHWPLDKLVDFQFLTSKKDSTGLSFSISTNNELPN